MTRVALKGMASRPLRTFLTTLAIVLGVGMVSAAFTLTDTMRGAANSLSSAAYDGTDAVAIDGQTTVMVTHDPRAAAAADRVLFLADGRIVGDLAEPTEDQVIDAMHEASAR